MCHESMVQVEYLKTRTLSSRCPLLLVKGCTCAFLQNCHTEKLEFLAARRLHPLPKLECPVRTKTVILMVLLVLLVLDVPQIWKL